jgi:hypothetical protein
MAKPNIVKEELIVHGIAETPSNIILNSRVMKNHNFAGCVSNSQYSISCSRFPEVIFSPSKHKPG